MEKTPSYLAPETTVAVIRCLEKVMASSAEAGTTPYEEESEEYNL